LIDQQSSNSFLDPSNDMIAALPIFVGDRTHHCQKPTTLTPVRSDTPTG